MPKKNGRQYSLRPPRTALADDVDRWRTLADRCGAHLAEIPHIAPAQVALKEVLGRLLQSFTEQAVLEAQLTAMFERRRRDVVTARDLRNRLTAGLHAHFGPSAEELRQFGLKPRARRAGSRQPRDSGAAN